MKDAYLSNKKKIPLEQNFGFPINLYLDKPQGKVEQRCNKALFDHTKVEQSTPLILVQLHLKNN